MLALAACDEGRSAVDAGATQPDASADAAEVFARELEWQSARLPLEADGRTVPASFELPEAARAFAVRSSLDPRSERLVCFQLEEVMVGGEGWVGRAGVDDYGDYCSTCRERVATGAGYGMHVLPSGADDVTKLGVVDLRVALRDCVTLTPLSAAEAGSGDATKKIASARSGSASIGG